MGRKSQYHYHVFCHRQQRLEHLRNPHCALKKQLSKIWAFGTFVYSCILIVKELFFIDWTVQEQKVKKHSTHLSGTTARAGESKLNKELFTTATVKSKISHREWHRAWKTSAADKGSRPLRGNTDCKETKLSLIPRSVWLQSLYF